MKKCLKSKYKIAYIMHKSDVATYGGFIQHVEHSIYGLKRLGHDVDFFFLGYVDRPNNPFIENKLQEYHNGTLVLEKQPQKVLDKGVGTGLYFHPNFGWLHPVTPIKTYANKLELKNKLETYDAVFWHTPFWFKQKSFLTDTDWPMLLDLKNPVNIAFHHDGNIRENSAWMIFMDKYFDRLITVHPASFNACSVFRTPRCMIFNPQVLDGVIWGKTNYDTLQEPIFFSLQYWKGSKHVDDLVRAIPYYYDAGGRGHFILGGKGMEYLYMNSKDKLKPAYKCDKKYDPDVPAERKNKPILQAARDSGSVIEPHWMNAVDRDETFKISSFFVDTAYYNINKELGEHFSRTLIEAMIHGVVPIGRNLGLSSNEEGVGDIFVPNENYLMIRHDATPKQFASKLLEFASISREDYDKIVYNNYLLLSFFELDYVCGEYIKVIRGEMAGVFGDYQTGEPTAKVLEKAEKQWFGDGTKRSFNFNKESKYAI